MSPFKLYRGMEDKLEHIFRDAHESVCANCLRTIDTEALKFCKGTHMLEPFCSNGCLKESWDAGVCADQSKLENDDKRSISLKRNILQAGYRVLQDSIGKIVGVHGLEIACDQGLWIIINLLEFPPDVRSGLLSLGDPSKKYVQVTFIAEDFRGFRDGVKGEVLTILKPFFAENFFVRILDLA
ncbi:hypothetical protein THAOC_13277 [Thalassiosira oceanica]|uniref:Uncharacterized protein n=1 Tax=Thalassiosira oceanica TaxID=159749 RepID=K0SKH8_THAOC|nr:hypothetical protein THAOC_13277 [Thalassiosira oceanica]|eukprot:EJK65825.1 hypothetical protein THAOC_13277 [Thalassiosira oceanica]